MQSLTMLVAVALACAGYGLGLARVLRLRFSDGLEAATLGFGLGAGVLAFAMFAVGMAGGFGTWSSVLLVCPAAALGAFWLVRSREPAGPRARPRWLRNALLALIALCVAANLFGSLAPPSFIDALWYHLYAPREYLRAGGIVELDPVWQTYQPSAVEMLYVLGLSLSGAPLSALLHAALGVVAAAAAALLGRRLAGPTGGLLAAAIFYATGMVAWLSTSCFVELGTAAFGALSLYAVLRWNDDGDRGWLLAAGLLGGFAAATKLPGGLFPLLGAALLVYVSLERRRGARATLLSLLAFGGVALLPVVPWFVRAWAWTGNPFYPFLSEIFGENPDNAAVWDILSLYGAGRSPIDLLLSPWRLVTQGEAFERGQYLGPLPVLLAPVLLWRARRIGERQALAGAAILFFAAWLAGAHIARYLVPILPLVAALVADALGALAAGGRGLRAAAILSAMPALVVGVAATLAYNAQFAQVVLGFESEDAFLARTSWYYPVYRAVSRELPPDARLLTADAPTYYLDRPHRRARDADFAQGPAHLWHVIARGRYTHVLVHGDAQVSAVAALGARVERLWLREVNLPASRSFGGTRRGSAALFRVRTLPW
jgi:hypothetical protein